MKIKSLSVRTVLLMGALLCLGLGLPASGAKTWVGGTNYWQVDLNWSPSGIPVDGDTVSITNGSVILSNSTASLLSFSITNATLTFTNWGTALMAGSITIQTNGILNHSVCNTNADSGNTNRVYLLCSNLTVNVGGLIDANGCGYVGRTNGLTGQGPGGGGFANTSGGGGGYGGTGGTSSHGSPGGGAYGSPSAPVQPGSGGAGGTTGTAPLVPGGNGGGAIFIQATNQVSVYGIIRANGVTPGSGNGGGPEEWRRFGRRHLHLVSDRCR